MDMIYTIIVVMFVVLAVLDLAVGVSNDAINFLNSAIGSRVASLRTILVVASCGILAGVITSHGMMEVARTGVMHPGAFTFREIMFLYAAVMLTDVILLNTFNKLGLPTSTTVSMIFELLGAAVAVSLIKIHNTGADIATLDGMVNGGKALTMISAILVSVALSFVVGGVVMWLSRLLFTFRYKRLFGRYGFLWCGVAIVGILYFAIIKGLKGSGLMTDSFNALLDDHTLAILAAAWVIAAVVLRLLQAVGVNILKVTILSGTFALALAFAGNDLVNFIGVPLAGLDAYQMAMESHDTSMLMSGLAQETPANLLCLLGAGVVMCVTLFFSRDAMRVSQTELTLASQNDEDERFSSSPFSRLLVRSTLSLSHRYQRLLPPTWVDAINRRFVPLTAEERGSSNYDAIRAVVNLACAAILICVGTSFKLPLSTTYVVFMVSMGSSLADRAWGRESAVYRITGVMVVIMGWFVTALVAFTVTMAVAALLMWGGGPVLIALVALCAVLLCRRTLGKSSTSDDEQHFKITPTDTPQDVLLQCTTSVCDTTRQVSQVYNRMLVALFSENRQALKLAVSQSEEMYAQASARKGEIVSTLRSLGAQGIETGHYYVQVIDYLCEVTGALVRCTRPAHQLILNNHHGLNSSQIRALKSVNDLVDDVFDSIDKMMRNDSFGGLQALLDKCDQLPDAIGQAVKQQIKLMQSDEQQSHQHATSLFFNILNETQTMVLQARNLVKSLAGFVTEL